MGFADSLKKNIQAVKKNVNDEAIKTVIQLANKIVDYSPLQDDALYPGVYAKGLFANSWYFGINSENNTVGTSPDESASGSRYRIEDLKASNAFLGWDGYISISNNLSYSYRVEYLGWPRKEGYTGFFGPYAPIRNAITFVKGNMKT